jgi:hypothetical protein
MAGAAAFPEGDAGRWVVVVAAHRRVVAVAAHRRVVAVAAHRRVVAVAARRLKEPEICARATATMRPSRQIRCDTPQKWPRM